MTLDDLLVGLLAQVSRFGIARIGPWAIDLTEWEVEAPSDSTGTRPAYSGEVVGLFEAAARFARLDGAESIDLVHLLVAYAYVDDGIARDLRERLCISPVDWRAALADWDIPEAGPGRRSGRTGGKAARERVELLTTEEAAAFLSVHPQTIRTYIRSGKLPAYRLAGERKIRIQQTDLLALLEPVVGDEDGAEEQT